MPANASQAFPTETHTEAQSGSESPSRFTPVLSALILSCFLLSGGAGLIYEILWVRMIDKVVGSAPFAVATVLAVFMGGLAVGSYLGGKHIDRITSKNHLLYVYGVLEVAIGIYGLLLPLLLGMAKPIYVLAYNNLFQYFWVYQLFTFLVCSLLLILPTSLMGVTLPVLCRFYVTHLDHLGLRTGRLYGLNTVGAALGALLCGFFLINSIGVWGTLFVAVAINILVGFLCILLGRVLPTSAPQTSGTEVAQITSREQPSPQPSPGEKTGEPALRWALWIFAVSGFAAMAYEVIWVRLLALIIGPTTYSFTLVVATFIIGLALGSLFFGWLGDRVKEPFLLLAGTQLAAACLALFVSQFLGNSQFFFAKLIYTFQDQFGEMILVQIVLLFFIMLGPTVLLGGTFPLVNRIYARSLPLIGKSIGTAYALNTVGAILGSFLAGFVLIPFLGKENGLRLAMAIQFALAFTALAAVLSQTKRSRRHWFSLSLIALAGIFLFSQFPSWNRKLLSFGRYRNVTLMEQYLVSTSWLDALRRGPTVLAQYENIPEIIFYGDGIGGFTTVGKTTDSLGMVEYSMYISGKADASSHGDRLTQSLLAHVPLLFHPNPEKVMVLGLASGMTAGEVLLYPVEQMDVLEINTQVVKASEVFTPWNNKVLSDPRTRLIVQDGRNHLTLTREKYDVIICGPSNPWMAGLANLFTLEFFQTVRDSLREHGIVVQWIHSYDMDWSTFALVGRNFTKVFPESVLLAAHPDDYLLVGFTGKNRFNPAVAERNIHYTKQSRNISLKDPRLLSHLIVTEDLSKLFGPGPLHTDTWPRLEFLAPKQIHRYDLSIEKRMMDRRWLSPQTKAIIEQSTTTDALLDMVEFLVSSYHPSPPFKSVDLTDATLAQRERYLEIVQGYCNQALVLDYDMFPDGYTKTACAQLQAAKISQHLTLKPEDGLAYSHQTLAFLQMGEMEEAVQAAQRAIRADPLSAEAHNYLGVALSQQGNLEEAVNHYSEALQIRPNYASARHNLAVALTQQGRLEEGVNQFFETLRINPDFTMAHNNLGLALARQGKLEEAMHHYSEALRINPDFVLAHLNLGLVLSQQGKLEEAMYHYSEALRINPDFAMAHNNLGLALARQGKLEEAMHHYSEALRINPDYGEARGNLGLALAEQGRLRQAIAHFSEAVRIMPNSAQVHRYLSQAYWLLGDKGSALREYEIVKNLDGELAKALRAWMENVPPRG